jgi:hypothetical protein
MLTVYFYFNLVCGVQKIPPSVNRIIGGQVAKPNSWPWQGSN